MHALKKIAEMVRDEHPSVSSIWLPPDGRLQMVGASLDKVCATITRYLAAAFRGRREDDFPVHYCAWGKARVGSTALNNLFGLAGFPSYYQPIKSLLRLAFAAMPLQTCEWPRPECAPYLFSKETQGPYTLGESLFIPIQVLVEAGYPPSKLHLIVLERDPERALASWLSKLTALQSPETLVWHYVISALNVNRVRRYALRHGIPVTHYVYEASKEPVASSKALFDRLGLAQVFSDRVVTDWGDRGQLDSSEAHEIIYPPQPTIYDLPGLHGSDTGYRYRDGGTSVSEAQRRLLETTGVVNAYQDAVTACIDDLGLDASTAARLFGRAPAEPVGSVARAPAVANTRVSDFEVSLL